MIAHFLEVYNQSVYDRLREPKFHLFGFFGGDGFAKVSEDLEDLLDVRNLALTTEVAEIFGSDKPFILLVRPDNYIGLISNKTTLDEVRTYLLGHPEMTTVARTQIFSSDSESFVKADIAGDRDLICRDAAFEEVGEFLHVLQIHEREWIFCSVNLLQAEHDETLVGDEFEILPHIGDRQARDAAAEDVFGKLHFALDGFVDHFDDLAGQRFVKKFWLLVTNLFYDLEGKSHVGRFVAKDPIRSRREPVKQAF